MAEADDGLFLIDGEDAGSTPWEFDSITNDGSCTFAIDATAKNNGSYGYKASYDGTNRNCYGVVNLSDPSTIYVRGYVYIPSAFEMGGTYETCVLFYLFDGTTDIIVLSAYCHGTTSMARWHKISEVSGVDEETDSVTNFSTDAWHYLEIKFVAGTGSDGIVECRCDGDTLFGGADTGLSTSALAPEALYVGNYSERGQEPANGAYMYFDDIKASASDWVGAYSEAGGGVSVPVMQNHYRRLRA